MACGCRAQGTSNGKPVCSVHFPSVESQTIAAEPNLVGRIARCADCKREMPSSLSLPFFRHQPSKSTDAYYCGCLGWD
jgi:hypothetical protein